MTKPKKSQYRIQYVDNTYQLVDWTTAEFNNVYQRIEDGNTMAICGNDMFRLTDIRAIVFLPPVPEPTPEEKAKEESHLTEWGFADAATTQWLREQGIGVEN